MNDRRRGYTKHLSSSPVDGQKGVNIVDYRFNSLEDFLISSELTIDGLLDDGWGALFPAKGREIKATIVFADISRFTARTLDLSPSETLIFVNNFFPNSQDEFFKMRLIIRQTHFPEK